MPSDAPMSGPAKVGRVAFGLATVVATVLGLSVDPRWLAASGAFGTIWWFWDLAWENILGPLGSWLEGQLTGTAGVTEPPDLTMDDTIRMLEDHLRADGVTRHVQIQSALRLAELYRLGRKDPAKADEVLRAARARWPGAPELDRFEKGEAGR